MFGCIYVKLDLVINLWLKSIVEAKTTNRSFKQNQFYKQNQLYFKNMFGLAFRLQISHHEAVSAVVFKSYKR